MTTTGGRNPEPFDGIARPEPTAGPPSPSGVSHTNDHDSAKVELHDLADRLEDTRAYTRSIRAALCEAFTDDEVDKLLISPIGLARLAVKELTRVRASRQDWAAEAEAATALLAQFVDQRDGCSFDHHGGCQTHGFLEIKPGNLCPNDAARQLLRSGLRIHAEKMCACITDNQAAQIGPAFSRPLCAVHPKEAP